MKARRILRALAAPAVCLTALAIATTASAQLAVSSNDNKVVNVNGVNRIPDNPAPDNVTIIDLGVSPLIVSVCVLVGSPALALSVCAVALLVGALAVGRTSLAPAPSKRSGAASPPIPASLWLVFLAFVPTAA